MMMSNLTKDEINIIRDIRIHSIIDCSDNGRRISIRCPIHNEKTPSFVLYSDNSFHCFGCGANGQGAIDFCIALGYNFIDALEELVKYI
jgi:DNA primase